MAGLILPRHPTAGAGVAVTFQGRAPNQGVFWEVVSVDPDTGAEGLARGSACDLALEGSRGLGARHENNQGHNDPSTHPFLLKATGI